MTGQPIFDVAAGLASLAGLVFSVMAWWNAKSAAEAARDARQEVRKGNAGEELRDLNERAKELLRAAQRDQLAEALVTAATLLGPLVQAGHRWKKFFGDEGTNRIKQASKKVEKVSVALSAGPPALTPADREKVIEFCHDVVTILAEESGKMLVLLEQEKKNG